MRWFFLLLLMVNVIYVAWELNREAPQPTAPAAPPRGVQGIVLLSELEAVTPQQDTVAPAVTEMPVELTKTTETMPVEVSEVALPAELSELQPSAEAAPDDSATVATDAVADQQDQSPAEEAVEQPTAYLCYTVGPFREMNTLRLVTREIKDYVVEASFRSREEREQTMFRVYLKPVGGKKEAKALIKQLVSKNIRDYYIITDGPNKNGISLGYFSEKARAHRHAGRVRKAGFDAVIEPVFRTYMIYWLDYRIEEGNEVPQEIFDRHLDSTAKRLSRSCT